MALTLGLMIKITICLTLVLPNRFLLARVKEEVGGTQYLSKEFLKRISMSFTLKLHSDKKYVAGCYVC